MIYCDVEVSSVKLIEMFYRQRKLSNGILSLASGDIGKKEILKNSKDNNSTNFQKKKYRIKGANEHFTLKGYLIKLP